MFALRNNSRIVRIAAVLIIAAAALFVLLVIWDVLVQIYG